jgi:hypothetical protein
LASGHKSGGLVLVLASGHFTRPKNARDLTFQPFVGSIGADRSGCFMLSGGVDKGGLAGIWKFVRLMVFPSLHLQRRPVVGRPEKVVVASGGKSVC